MSENPRTVDTRSQESVAADKSLVDAIQQANMQTMAEPLPGRQTSILQKAREKMGIGDGQEARVLVGLGTFQDEETDEYKDRVWLYAETTDKNGRKTMGKHLPISDVHGNDYATEEGWAHEEAVALMGMARGLQELKDTAVVANLDPSLVHVSDLRDQMMQLPKAKIDIDKTPKK